jgi:autotransporter-associated beta strand protein
VDLNYAPDLPGKTVAVPVTATNGAVVARLTAIDSPIDSIAYKIISGNTNNTFAIDPDTGQLTIANNALITGQLVSGFTLQVQAQDSGYHDLYPRKSTNVSVNVQLVEAAALTWSGNGTNDNWSQGANWSGAAPVDSTPLIFLGANRQTNINDLLAIIGPVAIGNSGFLLMGNPLTLRAGLASTGDNIWAIDSTLNKQETISSMGGTLTLAGSLNNVGTLLTLSANGTIQVDGIIAGMGGLLMNGPANVVLTAPNTFTGLTTVAAGTLVLLGNGSIGNSSSVDVMGGAALDASALAGGLAMLPGQTLTGSGVVRGNVVVSGTLAPGDSIGALSFSDALTLAGTLLIEINKTGPAITNDLVVVAGPLTLGGALVVSNTGSALADGDKFKLFDAPSFSGSFASHSLPPPGAGLVWNTTLLGVDGTLRVEAAPAPLLLPVSLNGGNLTVQFQSTTDVNYVLQAATNLVPPVAWASVLTNAGTGGLLTIPVPVDSSQPQRFYRLMAP